MRQSEDNIIYFIDFSLKINNAAILGKIKPFQPNLSLDKVPFINIIYNMVRHAKFRHFTNCDEDPSSSHFLEPPNKYNVTKARLTLDNNKI